jgi:hypothetical protein
VAYITRYASYNDEGIIEKGDLVILPKTIDGSQTRQVIANAMGV